MNISINKQQGKNPEKILFKEKFDSHGVHRRDSRTNKKGKK